MYMYVYTYIYIYICVYIYRPDPENTVGDQETGNPGKPVSSGLQVPGELGDFRSRTRPTW